MKFPVAVSCGYPSYEEAGLKWEDLEFKAYNLVCAVKGKPFNGYANFSNTRVDNTAAGRQRALRLCAGDAVQKLRVIASAAPLVPIPASDHIEFGAPFTGQRIVDAISAMSADFPSKPVLRFKNVMDKAAAGGTRSAAAIAAGLDLKEDHGLPDNRCILIDDVTTTGGHLRGAAQKLENCGINVVAAYCVAQTVWTRPAHLFRIEPFELDSVPDGFGF